MHVLEQKWNHDLSPETIEKLMCFCFCGCGEKRSNVTISVDEILFNDGRSSAIR